MAEVLIVVYLIIVLAMIVVILLQRSEGGALGMGGGNSGGMAPIRTNANLLTRTTGILAALFMATAIGLSIVHDIDRNTNSILGTTEQGQENEASDNVLDALNSMSRQNDSLILPPAETAPVGTAPVDGDAPNLAIPTAPISDPSSTAPQAPSNN